MSAVISPHSETGRRGSTSSSRIGLTYGRGGAGNVASPTATDLGPADLETPCIKSEVYTTGRGGSGNMAKNTDPAEARRAQDVTAPARRDSESTTYVGRGGVANVFKPSDEISLAARHGYTQWENAMDEETAAREKDRQYMGLADKGKEWLWGKMGRT